MGQERRGSKHEIQAEMRWDRILDRIDQGNHPPADELAHLVEHFGVPLRGQAYVAERLRNKVHLGDGGRPADNALTLLEKYIELQRLQAAVSRRQQRYESVRLDKPRSLDVLPPGHPPSQHTNSHPSLRLMSTCEECARVRILSAAKGIASGWQRTTNQGFKIKQPKQLAIRRVAVREGIEAKQLISRLEQHARNVPAHLERLKSAIEDERRRVRPGSHFIDTPS